MADEDNRLIWESYLLDNSKIYLVTSDHHESDGSIDGPYDSLYHIIERYEKDWEDDPDYGFEEYCDSLVDNDQSVVFIAVNSAGKATVIPITDIFPDE